MAEPREMYKRIGFERLSISRSSGSNASKPNQLNMKVVIVVLALVALAAAASAAAVPEVIPIVRSDFDKNPDGGYKFEYETGNKITQSEVGEIKQVVDEENKTHDVVVVRGFYSYTDNDGKVETINYTADETGFHPEGDSIPKAPARR